jgi:hypothetical protein
MTASMPDLSAGLHFVSVTYACTFGGITTSGGAVSFGVPDAVQFTFRFETGRSQRDPQVDLYDVTWDYSWFGQEQVEAAISAALSVICAAIGQLLSVPQAEVEQSVTVRRLWTFAMNIQGSAAPEQLGDGGSSVITSIMPYLPAVTSADAVSALEGAQAASLQSGRRAWSSLLRP